MTYLKQFLLIMIIFSLLSCDSNLFTQKQEKPPKLKKPKIHLVEAQVITESDKGISQFRTGTLRARYEVKIHNQEEGKIISLPYFEGDRVKKGKIIVRLDDSLLRAQLAKVKANRKKAESDLSRIKSLRKESFLSEEALINVQTELAVAKADESLLETRLSYANIKAPFSGIISKRLSEEGNIAERFTHILTLSDPSSLITQVRISELLLNHIKVGDKTEVQIDALGKVFYSGKVSRIHPNIDPITRRGTVEIELNPVPAGARPGQLCRIKITTQAAKRLLLPLTALRRDTEGEFVYIVDEDNKAQKASVVTGIHMGEHVEILSGLENNQKVITKGFLRLKPGKKVKTVKSKKLLEKTNG